MHPTPTRTPACSRCRGSLRTAADERADAARNSSGAASWSPSRTKLRTAKESAARPRRGVPEIPLIVADQIVEIGRSTLLGEVRGDGQFWRAATLRLALRLPKARTIAWAESTPR